jgi:hypothetical protein
MSILTDGRVIELLFFVVSGAVTWYFIYKAYKGETFEIRNMAQVQAISDGVDKAVEEGRSIFAAAGNLAYLSGLYSPMTINGMNVVRYTARLAIRRGARIILPVPWNPEAMPLIDGIFREAAIRENKPEAYRSEDLRYYGGSESAWMTGVAADVLAEEAALIIFIGATSSAEIFGAGAGLMQGAMVIAGTPRYVHQATWACMADYPLFCDDIYGAGALCSDDNYVKASILGEDIIKVGMIATLIVTLLLGLGGVPILEWFML